MWLWINKYHTYFRNSLLRKSKKDFSKILKKNQGINYGYKEAFCVVKKFLENVFGEKTWKNFKIYHTYFIRTRKLRLNINQLSEQTIKPNTILNWSLGMVLSKGTAKLKLKNVFCGYSIVWKWPIFLIFSCIGGDLIQM